MNFMGEPGPVLPYPGLRPFGPGESALFFGRGACVREMIGRMRAIRFLAVIGTSGSGKSSLVRTGLVHELNIGGMADAEPDWKVAECRPGTTPFARLAEALLTPSRRGCATRPVRSPDGAPKAICPPPPICWSSSTSSRSCSDTRT